MKEAKHYLIAVFALTYLLNLVLYLKVGYYSQLSVLFLAIQMVIPAAVAIAFIQRVDGDLSDYGFRFGGLRYYLLAYFLMVGYHVLHAVTNTALGLGRFVSISEGLTFIAPDLETIPSPIFLVFMLFVFGPIQNIVFGFGEEFGWRGYLVNKLLPGGLFRTIFITGVIWGLWHAPVILMGHNFPENPYLGVIIMTVVAIPLGAIFLWLRLKSGSAVVAGFAHGVLNSTAFLGGTFVAESSMIWSNPIGLLGIPLLSLVAMILFKYFPPTMKVENFITNSG